MSAEKIPGNTPQDGETVTERNLERLLSTAYRPEGPSEEFARQLRTAAQQHAAKRKEKSDMVESTVNVHASEGAGAGAGLGRIVGWSLAAAAALMAIVALILSHGRSEPKSAYRIPERASKAVPGTPLEFSGTPQAPAVVQAPHAPGTNYVPLRVPLPKPLFEGTPPALKGFNLAKPREPGEPFMVPDGCSNVALNKPVKSSDPEPTVGELKQVTDGDKEAVEGSFIELGPALQWVQIDLQGSFNIYAIMLWHFHKQARVYHAVVVQVADDPDFITNVRTVFNNDAGNSAGLGVGTDLEYLDEYTGKLIDAKGVKARYVRCYSKGNTSNDQNHYTEVEVHGIPAKGF